MGKRSLFWGRLGETNRSYTLGLYTGALLLPVYRHSWALYSARANVSLLGLFLSRGTQVNRGQGTDGSSVSTDSLAAGSFCSLFAAGMGHFLQTSSEMNVNLRGVKCIWLARP